MTGFASKQESIVTFVFSGFGISHTAARRIERKTALRNKR